MIEKINIALKEKSWRIFSDYRNELFGVAIISVVILHGLQDYSGTNISWLYVSQFYQIIIGSLGVTVFLFLSGMGLCFSFNKNNDVISFYKRRAVRILPTYLFISIFTLLLDLLIHGNSCNLKTVFFIDLFSEGNTLYWFIAFILLMYLSFPLIHKLLKLDNKSRKINFIIVECLSLLLIILLKHYFNAFYNNIIDLATRFPIMFAGVYYGEAVYYKLKFSKTDVLLISFGLFVEIISVILGIARIDIIPVFLQQLFFTLPFMVLTILLISSMNPDGVVRKLLRFSGEISLEIYLVHVSLRILFSDIGIGTGSILKYFILMIITLVSSVLIHNLMYKRKFCSLRNNY